MSSPSQDKPFATRRVFKLPKGPLPKAQLALRSLLEELNRAWERPVSPSELEDVVRERNLSGVAATSVKQVLKRLVEAGTARKFPTGEYAATSTPEAEMVFAFVTRQEKIILERKPKAFRELLAASKFDLTPDWVGSDQEVIPQSAGSDKANMFEIDLELLGYDGKVTVGLRLLPPTGPHSPGGLRVDWNSTYGATNGWLLELVHRLDGRVLYQEQLPGDRKDWVSRTPRELGFAPDQVPICVRFRPL